MAILIIILLIVGCFRTPPDPIFFPIAEGNTWVWETTYDTVNTIFVTNPDTSRRVIEDVYAKLINELNENIGALSWTERSDTTGAELIFCNETEGLYSLGFVVGDSIGYFDPQLTYKYPVTVGDIWPVKLYFPSLRSPWTRYVRTIKYSCVATNESFNTPLGAFDATVYYHLSKYAINGYNLHYFEFFTRGVGKVGTEVYITEPSDTIYVYNERSQEDLNMRSQLIEYHIY